MIEAELPDGRVLEFPDGTDQAVIQASVRKMLGVAPTASQGDVRKVENAMPAYKPEPTDFQRMATAVLKGGVQGGPIGAAAMGTGEGMNIFNRSLERGAYDIGGWVTDVTGSPEGGFAANVATQAVPAFLAGSITGKVAAPTMGKAAMWEMQKAVKPSAADLVSGNAERGIKTLLEEGINATPGGMAELRKRVSTLHETVTQTIKNSSGTVNNAEVANVERALNKFRYALVNRENNLQAIQGAKDEFLNAVKVLDPLSEYSGSIPVQLAQKLKQATQRLLADEFGSLSSAQYEGVKDITSNLRRAIEKVEPSVAGDNAKMEKLLNALSVTERHALVALNKNNAGLAMLAENPAAAAGFMADRSELFKSILARMIYSGRERVPQVIGGAGAALYEGVHNTPRQ